MNESTVEKIVPPPNYFGFVVVPQQRAYVVERLGKYHKTLEADWYMLIPFVDKIAYAHSLKEQALIIESQAAITKDNVTVMIDGVLYLKITDPEKASYGVSDAIAAASALAQTTTRSEIGKMTLDKTFEERESLNKTIVRILNEAGEPWGIQCLRYEIRDIIPPSSVRESMDQQAEAIRRKRVAISESEGMLQSDVNIAEGGKRALELKAEGEAAAILMKAEATAKAVRMIAEAVDKDGGEEAIALRVAEQYLEAFGNIAKESTTMMLPSNAADPSSMVAQAMGMYKEIVAKQKTTDKKQLDEDEDNF